MHGVGVARHDMVSQKEGHMQKSTYLALPVHRLERRSQAIPST
jgi:hypothetical protein